MKNPELSKINCPVKWITALMLGCGMFMVSGCASIISGTHQNVQITSQPDAAEVKVEQLLTTNNVVTWEGKTPAEVKLSRNGSYLVTVTLPGYQKAEVPVSGNGMNGWVFGNILIGGLVGIIVDSCSGAAKSLEPGTIYVNWADPNSLPVVSKPEPVVVPNQPVSKK